MTQEKLATQAWDRDELIQSHPVATLLLDHSGTIIFVNSAAEQLCNVSRSAMVGRALFDVIQLDSSYRKRILDAENPALFAHGVEIILSDRKVMLVDIQMLPSGSGAHLILAITPAQREADLLSGSFGRSGRAAGAAASMLAHEIKNPLAGIRGAAQLIARAPEKNAERFTTLICAEVDRIATLIDQMEHFSRGRPIACSPINLYPAILQAMETMRARPWKSLRLTEDFDPSIPMVFANHDAIVQILLNLVGNAGEAVDGSNDALVRVTTAYRHGLSIDNGDDRGRISLPIEIMVSDNGPGVPDDIRGDLFDPFVTTKREGRGLGLALVAKLVRDMGGTVQHSRDNMMTNFRVHLPVATATGEQESML